LTDMAFFGVCLRFKPKAGWAIHLRHDWLSS
jgi:hypothetical protein